jgi:arylsulfatase A-like enzyme
MLRLLVLIAVAGICAAGAGTTAAEPARLNIVVLLTDDLGYRDTSPYGSEEIRTPNLQRFAEAGCKFTNAFVASPACAPSRAALLTGLMPARNGAEANHSRPRAELKKLPAYLKELGYQTAAFGKVAHYKHGALYGFDMVDEGRHGAPAVAEFLAKRDEKRPLCLFVGTHDPHVPWPDNNGYDPATIDPPSTHVDTPQTRAYRAQYYTAVSRADTWLGNVFDLAREKLGPNTLFIFTSDHGAQWPFGKWNLYDAGIRVPMIVVWPGFLEPGSSSDALISWVDLLPTLVEVGGGSAPQGIDGRSFAAVLRGEKQAHRDRIFATHTGDGNMNVYPCRAVRTPEWKYILNLHPEWEHTTHIDRAKPRDGVGYWTSWVEQAKTDPEAAAIVKRYHQRSREELYDLTNDPHEQKNLAGDRRHAERLAEMRAILQRWMQEQGDKQTVFGKPRTLRESSRGSQR